jgi:hypothetical protein
MLTSLTDFYLIQVPVPQSQEVKPVNCICEALYNLAPKLTSNT